jgi:hypothetical protein
VTPSGYFTLRAANIVHGAVIRICNKFITMSELPQALCYVKNFLLTDADNLA